MSFSSKRILVISNLYPSKKMPYHGSFVKNFVDGLIEYNGRENTFYCVLKGRHYSVLAKLCQYVVFYVKIFCCLIFRNYDYVYVHLITHASLPIRIVSGFKKLNLIFNIHGEDLLVQSRLASVFLEIAKPMLYNSKLVVVPSRFFKNKTMELLPQLDEDKIFVSASSGVKECFYHKPSKKRNNVIGYVSRIDRGKGWDTLMKAVKILFDSGLRPAVRIIGGGAEVNEMMQMIEDFGLTNVEYLGPVEHDKLPDFYKELDLFVFPTRLEESLGLVGLEAMASGVPVIASEIGGITDYLDDGYNGFYFTPGNPEDLAKKIRRFIGLVESQKEALSVNARRTADKYQSNLVTTTLFATLFKL